MNLTKGHIDKQSNDKNGVNSVELTPYPYCKRMILLYLDLYLNTARKLELHQSVNSLGC